MLKERVTDLINRYEYGETIMTAMDVREELDTILDDEPWEEPLSTDLSDAIFVYVNNWRDAQRYPGHCDDGSDGFIEDIERIIGWEK